MFGFDIHNVRAEQSFFGLNTLPIDAVIDVGANRGQFAQGAIKVFPDAKFFCFEPIPEVFGNLAKWAETVPNRITVFNAALGSERKRQEFFLHPEHTMSSSFLQTTALADAELPFTGQQQRIEIDIHTLDDYRDRILDGETTNLLLKIDVEGFEIEALKGSHKTLENVIALIVEIHLLEMFVGHPTFWDVHSFLENKNYRFAGSFPQGTFDNGRVLGFDAIFIRKDFFG